MDNNKIIQQIQKMIAATEANKIPWKFSNTTNVRWVRQEENRLFTITLQAIPLNAFRPENLTANYSLTIQATNPNEIILQINTNTESGYLPYLKKLFEAAMNISRQASSDFLDKLLGEL